jgi:hypothetical protein
MKFIRDIIAEKTSMSAPDGGFGTEGETDDLEVSGAEIVLPNNGERVRSEIPASRVQNHVAIAASGNVGHPAAPDDQPVADLHDALDNGGDDSFGLSDGRGDDVETDAAQPCELFADIWEEENPPNPVDDDLTEDPFARQQTRADYDNPFFDAGEAPQQAATQDSPAAPAPEEAPSPFDRIETPAAEPSSPFQRFRRRQSVESSEPEIAESEVIPAAEPVPDPVAPVQVPAPAAGRSRRQAGRVKTRLLGFGNEQQDGDLFANGTTAGPAAQAMFPVGWMVVVAGPGCGTAFALQNGVSQIGRGEGQAVRLDYGDTSISRENHAAVAYDSEQREFFLGHGGKANLVRLNGKPVLSTEPLSHGALIRIGETTLRFVGFCGSEFDWGSEQTGGDENARFD